MSGSSGSHTIVRYIARHYGIRSNDRSRSNRHARADHDILAEPGASLNKDRLDLFNALSHHGGIGITVLVDMVRDIHVTGEEHVFFQFYVSYGRDDACASDACAFAYPDGNRLVLAVGQSLKPGTRSDENAVTNCDPLLPAKTKRIHQNRLTAETSEGAGNKQRKKLAPHSNRRSIE